MVHYRKCRLNDDQRKVCINKMIEAAQQLRQVGTYTEAACIYRDIIPHTHILNQKDYDQLMRYVNHDSRAELYDFILQLS